RERRKLRRAQPAPTPPLWGGASPDRSWWARRCPAACWGPPAMRWAAIWVVMVGGIPSSPVLCLAETGTRPRRPPPQRKNAHPAPARHLFSALSSRAGRSRLRDLLTARQQAWPLQRQHTKGQQDSRPWIMGIEPLPVIARHPAPFRVPVGHWPPCPQQPGGQYLYNPRNDLWFCNRLGGDPRSCPAPALTGEDHRSSEGWGRGLCAAGKIWARRPALRAASAAR